MATTPNTNDGRSDERRASPLGAYITTAGAIIVLVSVWLNWVSRGPADSEENTVSGYEADSLIPFMAYLGLGFAVALLYATVRADRRQHRGLSLASMAVGLASLLWCLSFVIDPSSTAQYNENVSTEIGPYIALLGSLLWTVGSFLLAKEPEGDFEPTRTTAVYETRPTTATTRVDSQRDLGHTTGTVEGRGATSTGTETYGTDPGTGTGTGTTGYR